MKEKVQNLIVNNARRGTVSTSLTSFPSPYLASALKEGKPALIGKVSLPISPSSSSKANNKKVKVVLNREQFKQIHGIFIKC